MALKYAILMKLNKDCRRIWANYLGGSNFKFDKEFLKYLVLIVLYPQ